MDTDTINHVSLCSGYGGIDLGLKRAIGRSLRTVAYVEVESFAVANLVAKASQELLDEAPVWSDLRSFPWGKFHGLVDILSGGYPCQPFSAAGKRLGAEDPRHLWPFISAGIALMRPAVCFFENVEGHISLGLPDVIEDLAGLGYRTTWGIFSASEVGAPHQRKRVFILAVANSNEHRIWPRLRWEARQGSGELHSVTGELADSVEQGLERFSWDGASGDQPGWKSSGPDGSTGEGSLQAWPSRPGEQQFAWEPPRVVVDAKSQRAGQRPELRSEECGSRSALSWDVEQSGEGAVANNHSSHAGHGEQRPERTLGDLSGGCGEAGAMGNAAHTNRRPRVSAEEAGAGPDDIWRRRSGESGDGAMGDAVCDDDRGSNGTRRRLREQEEDECARAGRQGDVQRQTQPPLGRDADGPADWLDDAELFTTCDNRTDELRLLGNGVVPATAERAFRVLVGELIQHANP